MVYFTCNNCGQSLKKNEVAKHSFRCKPLSLTCVDCLKDFYEQEYEGHTSCVTEQEKYSAKGFKSKPVSNKGALKRQTWDKLVHEVCKTPRLNPRQQHVVNIIKTKSNIPSQRLKFENYVKAMCQRTFDSEATGIVFCVLEAAYKAEQQKDVKGNDAEGMTEISQEAMVEKNEPDSSKKKKKVKATDFKEAPVTSQEVVEERHEETNEPELSKKEQKVKRKREKYEESLREAAVILPVEDGYTVDKEESKKRKKKRKHDAEVADEIKENGDSHKKRQKSSKAVAEIEPETNGKKAKKSKKRKLNEENEELDTENIHNTAKEVPADVNDSSAPKFNWSDTILAVLEATKDKELSVKRLRKKVVAEYETVFGNGHETEIQIIAKFNKKLSKIRSVVLLKDKAKLKCCRD